MKRGVLFIRLLSIVMLWCIWNEQLLAVHAEIASDDAFVGVTWEKIIEDDIEAPKGIIQSMCATEDYIICIENFDDSTDKPDIIKAYYRNDTDAYGNKVEKYSLAKRVVERSYEHGNGMAYNPNTGEIAVALYTHLSPENRGCIFLMDSKTLSYKGKVKISDDYNILGIGYDGENDRYIIQTNVDGGYSFKILDNQFQVIEDLGEYAGTSKGNNFQDLCVSGDYIINFPLTLNMGIGDFINVYSISRRALVSCTQLDFNLGNITRDEPESICELEPGVFAAVVNVDYADGTRKFGIYKTMVPYNFPAVENEDEEQDNPESSEDSGVKADDIENDGSGEVSEPEEEKVSFLEAASQLLKTTYSMKTVMKAALIIFILLDVVLVIYLKVLSIRRKRKRKLEHAKRERQRIQQHIRATYGE